MECMDESCSRDDERFPQVGGLTETCPSHRAFQCINKVNTKRWSVTYRIHFINSFWACAIVVGSNCYPRGWNEINKSKPEDYKIIDYKM